MQSAVHGRDAHFSTAAAAKPLRSTSSNGTDQSATAATVNGRPIARREIVDLLLRSHGAGLLEQLILLEAAQALAEKNGIAISEADVDREYTLALRRISDPAQPVASEKLDRPAAEGLLESVLAERNISRDEFFITIRRNAYLRSIVLADRPMMDADLRAEYSRRFGERVQVRAIQFARLADAQIVREKLAAGEDFAELARRYSQGGARNAGLMTPFCTDDEEVPALLRQTAFSLELGQVSAVLRVGEWHYVIRLERRIPAEPRDFQEVIAELTAGARERISEPLLRERLERLEKEAVIEIHDPMLREAYERRKAQTRR
jgi:parvulin-like peptidyl-prolyl isomerase